MGDIRHPKCITIRLWNRHTSLAHVVFQSFIPEASKLTLKGPNKNAADDILIYYFYLLKKRRLDFSCESFA